MVHVFIVNEKTFKYHLEYMFAGTGAADKLSPFLQNAAASIHFSTERNLMGMIADISRIRIGDKIIFYLQATKNYEGQFFGTFKVLDAPFWDENDENNYLKDVMEKGLSYRVKIEPDVVYAKGVTEHQLLDSLDDIEKVSDMCWSLIYRKLKANRGCTMITDKEYLRLLSKLRQQNNNQSLNITHGLTFNSANQLIETTDNENQYNGRTNEINIKDRLIYKFNSGRAFETHLQAYILQTIDRTPLKELLLRENLPTWIGNEVSCGVGMQRIDILTLQEDENNVYANIIELKCGEAYDDIVNRQLPWYIKWFNHYIGDTYNKNIIIQPVVLTYETDGVVANQTINVSQLRNNVSVLPVKNIFFTIQNNEIVFRLLEENN